MCKEGAICKAVEMEFGQMVFAGSRSTRGCLPDNREILERRQSMADIAPGPFGQGLRISPVQVIWAFNIIDVEM